MTADDDDDDPPLPIVVGLPLVLLEGTGDRDGPSLARVLALSVTGEVVDGVDNDDPPLSVVVAVLLVVRGIDITDGTSLAPALDSVVAINDDPSLTRTSSSCGSSRGCSSSTARDRGQHVTIIGISLCTCCRTGSCCRGRWWWGGRW